MNRKFPNNNLIAKDINNFKQDQRKKTRGDRNELDQFLYELIDKNYRFKL